MRKWEGRITHIDDEILTAELVPSEDAGGPSLVADFDVSLLESDAEDARVGDLVYVTVRKVHQRGHGTTMTSALRLCRLGRWSSEELNREQVLTHRRMRSLADLAE
jgi:hypothetical protein